MKQRSVDSHVYLPFCNNNVQLHQQRINGEQCACQVTFVTWLRKGWIKSILSYYSFSFPVTANMLDKWTCFSKRREMSLVI